MRVAIVNVDSKETCLKLQNFGFTIGRGNNHLFGWKMEKELTEQDRQAFTIKIV